MANFYSCRECDAVLLDINENAEACTNGSLKLLHTNAEKSIAATHQPVVSRQNGKVVVQVGREQHPMGPEHAIEWVYVETSFGGVYQHLHVGDEPKVNFALNPDEVLDVYAYSKQHGLWKAQQPIFAPDFEQNEVACSPEFANGCVNMTEE